MSPYNNRKIKTFRFKMVRNQQVCVSCYQGISNPICEKCHTKQLAVWLNDYDANPKIITNIIRRMRKSFSIEKANDALCIICGTELVSICTYCYFFKVDKVLQTLNLPEETIENFLEIFNYKLYNSIFSREED